MASEWFAVVADGPAQVLTLAVPMQVDSADFDKLHEQVLGEVTAKPSGRWVIDLTGLAYMGSSVLGLLVNIRERVRQAGGKLALCGLNARLQQVFRTCSLERLFVIRAARAEALDAVNR
jgi:anti-anti-sigma factor